MTRPKREKIPTKFLWPPHLVAEFCRDSPHWWVLAENPPCEPWCEIEHDPNEFRIEGASVCWRYYDHGVSVALARNGSSETPFLVESEPATVIVERNAEGSAEWVEVFVAEMQAAAAFARTISAGDLALDLEEYRRWMVESGLSRSTIKQRMSFAAAHLAQWGSWDVPAHQISAWLNEHNGWTRRTYFSHLRSLYAWLIASERIETSPIARYRAPAAPAPRANPLTADEVRLILDTAEGDLRAWFLLALYSGLRLHEIAKIHGKDLTETEIRVAGKGGVVASIPTHPKLWALAQEYPRDDWWFPSPMGKREYIAHSGLGNQVRAHFRTNGIPNGGIHRLRHTYATNLRRAGVDPRRVQALMRHSSLDTTMRYLDVTDPELLDAIKRLE
ncbi:MAG: site-specific integrase [Nocardioides sp.]|uniref:tyrosine-type recombinase/integrase n=1 Tax=Nocardioides sp. TaxID=35761 RepID=UPI0023A2BC15|nr:site-specific integrase [Nocardioides sp.]MDE0778202.1 site-specific integrase [Nocardioides sp.]